MLLNGTCILNLNNFLADNCKFFNSSFWFYEKQAIGQTPLTVCRIPHKYCTNTLIVQYLQINFDSCMWQIM